MVLLLWYLWTSIFYSEAWELSKDGPAS